MSDLYNFDLYISAHVSSDSSTLFIILWFSFDNRRFDQWVVWSTLYSTIESLQKYMRVSTCMYTYTRKQVANISWYVAPDRHIINCVVRFLSERTTDSADTLSDPFLYITVLYFGIGKASCKSSWSTLHHLRNVLAVNNITNEDTILYCTAKIIQYRYVN